MPIRMKDVAQDLGLSVVTISKVLRNHQDISSETRDRVLKKIKELGYRPNWAARSLVTGKSYLMGLVVPDLLHPFFAEVAKGASRTLRKQGYSLVLSSSEEDPKLEKQEIEQLLGRGLDAFIIASAQAGIESFEQIQEQGKPYVLVDRKFSQLSAPFVGVDDRAVGTMATEHLLAIGCRRIAYIGGPNTSPAIGRLEGYREALSNAGRDINESYIMRRAHGDDSSDVSGHEAMNLLLDLRQPPDGVFCYNDPMAMGAMKAIVEHGKRIPADIAIIGCGNLLYSSLLRVPLSTIDQESQRIGERAAKLALALVAEKRDGRKPKSILMEPKLIVRESTRREAGDIDG
jgi:LacI family transcriptional regulator